MSLEAQRWSAGLVFLGRFRATGLRAPRKTTSRDHAPRETPDVTGLRRPTSGSQSKEGIVTSLEVRPLRAMVSVETCRAHRDARAWATKNAHAALPSFQRFFLFFQYSLVEKENESPEGRAWHGRRGFSYLIFLLLIFLSLPFPLFCIFGK